jgi:hypothetical protein
MDRHLGLLELLLVVAEIGPGQGPVDLGRTEDLEVLGEVLGGTDLPFHRRESALHEAELLHPLPALDPDPVPAHGVAVPARGDVLREGMERKMGRGEGHVVEEGLSPWLVACSLRWPMAASPSPA